MVTRGAFLANGQWHPIPYVDPHKAELVFRYKLLRLLRDRDLISEERIDLLLSWRHSGFNVHNHTTVYPNDTEGLHRLACYLHRAPVNLSRLRFHPESGLLIYEPKAGHDVDDSEPIDPLEFLARVLIHIPEPNKHLVHFYGAYANRVRSSMPHGRDSEQSKEEGEGEPAPAKRAVRKRWAELIYKIYNVDPLTCRLWNDIDDAPKRQRGGRLIMLGTPNRGSYAIPSMLSGHDSLLKWLERIDVVNDMKQVLRIVSTFPGSYQMLPTPELSLGADDHKRLYQKKNWGPLGVHQQHLDRALSFQRTLFQVKDPHRLIYVAGYGEETLHRIRIDAPGKFRYLPTRRGDGRVPHELGLLEEVPTQWVREAHGDLPKNGHVLDGIHDLLQAGETPHLGTEHPSVRAVEKEEWKTAEELLEDDSAELDNLIASVRRGTRSDKTDEPSPETVHLESRMTEDYLGRVQVDEREAPAVETEKRSAPSLKVDVVWGDITKSKGDVYCVGHYHGVIPQRAEAALEVVISDRGADKDRRVLTSLTRRGAFRGALGEISLFPWAGKRYKGRTLAVAGMGYPGSFDESRLRHLASSLAWTVGLLPDTKTICMVLIGSGAGGLEPRQALRGMLNGLSDAFRGGLRSGITEVSVVEIQLSQALRIHHALRELAPELGSNVKLNVGRNVRRGRKGVVDSAHSLSSVVAASALAARQPAKSATKKSLDAILGELDEEMSRAAERALKELVESTKGEPLDVQALAESLEVGCRQEGERKSDGPARISFGRDQTGIRVAAITDTAVTPERVLPFDFGLIEELTSSTTDPDPDPEEMSKMSGLLNRLLIPRDFRDFLRYNSNIVIEVDRRLATVHWELMAMEPNHDDGLSCIGLRARVARQLRTTYSPPILPRPPFGNARRALVVGDPGDPATDDDLPGASLEAERVGALLRKNGFKVDLRIGAPNRAGIGPLSGVKPASRLEVLQLLHTGEYDVLHYAGHGDFDEADPTRVGWVFKGGLLTADELATVDRVPQLVVANACLSSRTSDALRRGERIGDTRSESGLLPSLADEFFRRGVQNYIGTAWAIDDEGAILFAERFYEEFLQKREKQMPIGEALLKARRLLFERTKRYGALWSAYQHYGDPDLKL